MSDPRAILFVLFVSSMRPRILELRLFCWEREVFLCDARACLVDLFGIAAYLSTLSRGLGSRGLTIVASRQRVDQMKVLVALQLSSHYVVEVCQPQVLLFYENDAADAVE